MRRDGEVGCLSRFASCLFVRGHVVFRVATCHSSLSEKQNQSITPPRSPLLPDSISFPNQVLAALPRFLVGLAVAHAEVVYHLQRAFVGELVGVF